MCGMMTREVPEITQTVEQAPITHEGSISRLHRVGVACGKLAALGCVIAGSGVASAFLLPAETSFGPHEAEVELTVDGNATFDLGPIGSIIKPLNGSNGLGARITIGEVPMDGQESDVRESIDVEEYARVLSNFKGDVDAVKADLFSHAAKFGMYGGAGSILLYGLVGARRRKELIDKIDGARPKAGIIGMASLNIVTAACVGMASASTASELVAVDSAFAGTPLEGTYLTGNLLPKLINTYGRDVMDRLRENDDFYDEVVANLGVAFEDSRTLEPHRDYPTMLFYTDLHCNVGMARVIGETARLSGAMIVADGGDTTMGGTAYEEFCVNILGNELPRSDRVGSGGNHDGEETEQQMRRNNFSVLNGEVVEIEGLRILGDDDPMRSDFGMALRQEQDETLEQLSERLADTACSDERGVDILLVHVQQAAQESLARGCVNTVLSGHTHNEEITTEPDVYGNTVFQLVGDNASGAKRDRPSMGPIETSTALYSIRFSKESGRVLAYQTVTINPDASVEIGDVTFVP